jgi:hypothetical protein
MIDLEDALARIVELAPEPPDVAGVTRRAKQRRTRRHGGAIAAVLVVAIGIASAIALRPTDSGKRVILTPTTESVNVTLLDGSHLEITGPRSIGLTKLQPTFNGALVNTYKCLGSSCPVSHSFTVRPADPHNYSGQTIGRYPTGDGHELVVYPITDGQLAEVRYGRWELAVPWNDEPANWAAFAKALHARETADGFLVFDFMDEGWHLGPTDAPDADFNHGAFSFFGPQHYPSGCPTAAETDVRTAQGWPVSRVNGTWWCDADEHVRVRVGDPEFFDDAIDGLRVEYTAAERSVEEPPAEDRVVKIVTTLDGQSFEVSAPTNVLDRVVLQSTLVVDGLTTKFPMVIAVERDETTAPRQNQETNATADGNRLVGVLGVDGEEWLEGKYGDWYVTIIVEDVSVEDRARIASLFAAHVNADGYLVLDPRAPMHFTEGLQPDITLNRGFAISWSEGQIRTTVPIGESDWIRVRRIG